MAKLSQLDTAIASLKAERDQEEQAFVDSRSAIDMAIGKLEALKLLWNARKIGSVLDESAWIPCELCGKRATWCCSGLEIAALFFCDKCAAIHGQTCPDIKRGAAQIHIMGQVQPVQEKAVPNG